MVPECNCDECRRIWFIDLISYATTLEGEILAAFKAAKVGRMAEAYGHLYALQEVVRGRDLTGEMAAEAEAYNEKTAAELREAGRLH